MMAKNGKPQERNWFFFIAAEKNDITEKIDNSQQNSNCRLCGLKEKTNNYIISENIKRVGIVVHWKLCKRLFASSAAAVEYTDCIYAEEYSPQ